MSFLFDGLLTRALLCVYIDTWRRQRKFFHFAQLKSHVSNPYYVAALNQNVRRTIEELLVVYSTNSISSSFPPLNTDKNLKTHWHHILEGYICGVVSQLAYGYIVQSSTEKYVRKWVGFYNEFEKAAEPARYAVNVFPWLRFVPAWLGPWKGSGKEYLKRERAVIEGMFEGVGRRMEKEMEKETEKEEKSGRTEHQERQEEDMKVIGMKGIPPGADNRKEHESKQDKDHEPWSIAKLYFLDPGKWATASAATNLTPHEAAYTLGAFIEASMAGTPAALKLFFQAMLWYPEWQERIYDEICEACGRTSGDETTKEQQRDNSGSRGCKKKLRDETKSAPRMPELSDIPRLPIIRAVIKEMLRWRPTLPGDFPTAS